MRRPYEFARVQLTRFRPARRRAGGVRFTRLRRKARHHLFSAISLPKALLPPDSVVLLQLRRIRWHLENNRPDLWSEVGWLRKFYPFNRTAARRAHGSSAERRRKIGAPAEAQRSGFGGVRRSKGANAVFAVGRNEVERTLRRRNRVKCTIARPKEVPLGEDGSHKARQNGPKH